ncbi:MAG: glycosyltransferase [Bacilli bacterium]|nr:glycosyltransferase [Bacilli bacterium]
MEKYKKKIAIVISSLEIGGAEKMVLDLIEKIKECLDLKLFVIKKNFNSSYDLKAKELGIDIIYLNHRIKIFSLTVAIKLKKELDKYKPDIIHSHLKASTYIYFYNLFNKNFKWIHTIHTIAKVDTKIIRRMFFRNLYNKKRINLIAVSKNVEHSAKVFYKNADIRVINNGINLNKFKKRSANYSINNYGINIINVGRLEVVKNHDYLLIEISKLHKELRINKLYLIGDGKRKDHINELIKKIEMQDVIEIITYTSRVNEYLNMADIFVLSSIYEGMPLAVIEAMASGLIIIATSAAKDVIIDNYNGFIIDLKKDSLYIKLKQILEDISKYEYIRENALLTAKDYSINKMANEYLGVYLEE